jgi:hypothetical protein
VVGTGAAQGPRDRLPLVPSEIRRALAWAHQQELEADRNGLPTVHKVLRGIMVADVLTRYRDEIIPRKRGADRETFLLNAFLRHPLAKQEAGKVTTGMVSAYCAERLRREKPATVNRELDILRHAFATARRNRDMPLTSNPFADIVRPKGEASRERRLSADERDRLQVVCNNGWTN